MKWDVEVTDQLKEWYWSLPEEERNAVVAAVEVLEEDGPALGRPLVDRIHSSRHQNMKELRAMQDAIRILFAFDPRRIAILLIAGSKEGRWHAWYDEMVPVADDLFDEHLAALREEGFL